MCYPFCANDSELPAVLGQRVTPKVFFLATFAGQVGEVSVRTFLDG